MWIPSKPIFKNPEIKIKCRPTRNELITFRFPNRLLIQIRKSDAVTKKLSENEITNVNNKIPSSILRKFLVTAKGLSVE